MPRYKALEFFAGGPAWGRGIDWYRRQFAAAPADAVALGEASNVYAKYPTYSGVPSRIASVVPDVRLIYVIRHPIERIRSHYETRVIEGRERAPFERAVLENSIYLDYSRYALQIEQYLEHFARSKLMVIQADDLKERRAATIQQVYEYLGVDPTWLSGNIDREFHRSTDRPSRSLVPLWARTALKKHLPAARRAKELEANVLRRLRPHRRSNDRRETPRAEVSAQMRERLVELLGDDVRRLRGLIGPAFDGWGIA
jgi:hypothetical protein